jgi:tetratricopeptide (TPR) repeat protein
MSFAQTFLRTIALRSPKIGFPFNLNHYTYVHLRYAPRTSTAQRYTKRWATSRTPHSTASDPAEEEALLCLEQGTQKLEEGDVEGAKKLYQRSVDIKRNASSLFNLGVTHYHLKEFDEAIHSWKLAIELQPSSADAHTNLASAYLNHSQSRPDLALQHLQVAAKLAPEDPEIAFNLASILEACQYCPLLGQSALTPQTVERLPEALEYYKRSKRLGIDRAAVHIKDVSTKIEKQPEGENETTTKPSST